MIEMAGVPLTDVVELGSCLPGRVQPDAVRRDARAAGRCSTLAIQPSSPKGQPGPTSDLRKPARLRLRPQMHAGQQSLLLRHGRGVTESESTFMVH